MSFGAPVRRHLRLKVITLVTLCLIVGFGLLVILNIQHEQRLLVAANRDAANLLAASIVSSIQNGMLQARPDIIRRLVGHLKTTLKDVRRLDVYRRNGVEAFSDLETMTAVLQVTDLDPEVVKQITRMRREPGPRIDHPLFTRAVERVEPQETEEALAAGRVLTLFRPLRNLEPCRECHSEEHQVRGVVRISLDLAPLEAALAAGRNRQVTVAGLTILGVTAILIVLLGHVVLAPIRRVMAAARRLGSGDLDARVPVTSQDEIGELGQVINDMGGRLKEAREALEARNAELARTLESLQDSLQKVALLEQVKGELVKFVPEAVTRLLERNPDARELEKRESDVSVVFLDVEGYTRLSEQLPPQRLNRMIQDYFSAFLEIIRRRHGDVNETAGDGLMVIFQSEQGPARHALNAAGAAFELLAKVGELNREFAGTYPPVAIHVGINSGLALVGATKLDAAGGGRWTFTASGPTTNLAARVAGLTKGGEVMVGPETAARIQIRYVLEDAGEHRLKNVSAPVHVFRLVPAGVYRQVVT